MISATSTSAATSTVDPAGSARTSVPSPRMNAARNPEVLDVPPFGEIPVFLPPGVPSRAVVLLVETGRLGGDASALAERAASGGALVAVVDVARLLEGRRTGGCAYPAGDLEAVAQDVEKRLGLPEYLRPILVGHGRGAALAYAALAQAPAGTFAGGIAAGLCPDEPLPVHVCPGAGPPPRRGAAGDRIVPGGVDAPLVVLSGGPDRCRPAQVEAFARGVPGATLVRVPASRRGSAPGWVGAAADAVAAIGAPAPAARGIAASAPEVKDLPVVEAPAAGQGKLLAVMLTGDGGWVGLDKGVARGLNAAGVSVVGLDSLRYFWKRRTPAETARDVGRIVEHYRASWDRPDVILVGYSRGADVAPFVAALLPSEARSHLRLVAMLGPSTYAEFEVHVIDLFSSTRRSDAMSTERAVRATGGSVRMLCVHGTEEHDSLCPRLQDLPWVKDAALAGGHHFGGDTEDLARLILDAAEVRSSDPAR